MKQIALLVAVVTYAMVSACASTPTHIDRTRGILPWLVGTWATEGSAERTVETWHVGTTNGAMVGTGNTTRDGKVIFTETLVLEERADGVYYVASPQGQPTNAFPMIESSDAHAIFEDLAHDFPYRITYTLESHDVLVATIYGRANGKERSASWRYRRMN